MNSDSVSRKDAIAARIGTAAQAARSPAHSVMDHLDALTASMGPLPLPHYPENERDA